ncbi:MAG: helix-turn-helix domain-containing protein [Planctomycetota bacterium]
MQDQQDDGAWTRQLAIGPFRQLFDRLPGTMLFAKDTQFRLRMGSPTFVARCCKQSEAEILGLSDNDLFPARLAAKYRHDDERILRSREPLFDLLELFPNQAGSPEWSLTDKLPLFDRDGRICGIGGVVRIYEGQREALQPYLDLAEVAEHLRVHYAKPLDVENLAKMAGLSARQFSRKFRATFQLTPQAYLMQLRILRACELLRSSQRPITEIALEAGFYDHADFARHFRRHMGVTATAYRQSAAERGPSPEDRSRARDPAATTGAILDRAAQRFPQKLAHARPRCRSCTRPQNL